MCGYGLSHNQPSPFDGEMADSYSAMRKRPDGKSLGVLHDVVWHRTAVAFGLYYPMSEAE